MSSDELLTSGTITQRHLRGTAASHERVRAEREGGRGQGEGDAQQWR